MTEGGQSGGLNYDWMFEASWADGELMAARRLAEIGRAALDKGGYTTNALVKLSPEVDRFLPFDEAPGYEAEMRHRVAARARGILTGEIDPNGS